MYANTPREASSLLQSEAKTVAGSAAIDISITAFAPFIKIHAQLSSIRSATPHSPLHTSPNTTSDVNNSSPISRSSRKFERPAANNSRKRLTAPTYVQDAATFVARSPDKVRQLTRPRPDRANRQAAALFNVPDPGRIVFARLQFAGYNQTAPIANMDHIAVSTRRCRLSRQLSPHSP